MNRLIKHTFVISLIFLFTGCAAARFTQFKGIKGVDKTFSVNKDKFHFAALRYFYENDFEVYSSIEELGVIKGRYRFLGTETWGSSKALMSKYSESIGIFINPYGKNAFVEFTLLLKPANEIRTFATIKANFKTWGEPDGVGGAGPYPMNSKFVWEEELLNNISEYSKTVNFQPKSIGAKKDIPITKKTGTGFIISSNGYLLTNYHVVKGAKEIKIKSASGEEINAVLIMKDASNDIAVLKINEAPANIETNMHLGDSSKVKAGDKVFTIGYPFSNILGKQARYTEGTISSLFGIQDDPRWFQISVPIQPGNSGAPLFNEKGEIIGIVVASLDAKNVFEITGAFPQNISFAIKSAYIKNMISMMPNLGSALFMPTDLSLGKGESKSFIERAKNNIVLIEAK